MIKTRTLGIAGNAGIALAAIAIYVAMGYAIHMVQAPAWALISPYMPEIHNPMDML